MNMDNFDSTKLDFFFSEVTFGIWGLTLVINFLKIH